MNHKCYKEISSGLSVIHIIFIVVSLKVLNAFVNDIDQHYLISPVGRSEALKYIFVSSTLAYT